MVKILYFLHFITMGRVHCVCAMGILYGAATRFFPTHQVAGQANLILLQAPPITCLPVDLLFLVTMLVA